MSAINVLCRMAYTINDVERALAVVIAEHGTHKRYLIAYSGGLDSTVLLAALAKMKDRDGIHCLALHIHHGLSINADDWSTHCQTICSQLALPYQEIAITLRLQPGDSLEERARLYRYQAFANIMQKDDVLLTAHHSDDQAETLLMQLLRGAGLKGLSAMPMQKPFAEGWHVRPFILLPRQLLQDYATIHSLSWINDESNHNERLTRNYLRHTIFPLLQRRWPTVAKSLSRSALHCAEAQVMLDEYALTLYHEVLGTREHTLSVQKLLALTLMQQRLVLRYWIESQGHPLPNTDKLYTLQATVLKAAKDKMPSVVWGETAVRRYRDNLHITPHLLTKKYTPTHTGFHVQYRQGGEIVMVPGRGKLALKNLFQEWGVPPWERELIPLYYKNGALVGVEGYLSPV